jgi:hypothetical protein
MTRAFSGCYHFEWEENDAVLDCNPQSSYKII